MQHTENTKMILLFLIMIGGIVATLLYIKNDTDYDYHIKIKQDSIKVHDKNNNLIYKNKVQPTELEQTILKNYQK